MAAIGNVLVLGAGIGGLTATVSLMRKGIGVDLVEVNADTTVQGIGISLLGPALRAMKMIGLIDEVVAAGVGGADTLICNAGCEVVNRIPMARLAGPEYPASVGILRPAFQEILRQAAVSSGARIRLGMTFQYISQDASGVDVTFTDGSTSRYDLVIAADGINSSVRTQFFDANLKPEKTGQSVWRATIPRLPGVDDLMLVHGPRNTAGFNPVSRDEMYVFLVQNTSLVVRDTGQWPALLREQLLDFGGTMAHARQSIVDANKIVWRPLETVFCPAPWYRGRIVLLGDAAHATTPHLASGAGQAIEDAIVLAEEVAHKPTLAGGLEGYMGRRYERSRMVYESSIQLGKWEMNPSTVDANPDKLRIDCMRQLAQPL